MKFNLFFIALLVICGCAGPANNAAPVNRESAPLLPGDAQSVHHIINQLLLFGSDNPLDWQKARAELNRLEKSLPSPILTKLKETESADQHTARLARESLTRQGKISFYLTKLDSADYQEWTDARENLIKLGSEAVDNMVLALSGKLNSSNQELRNRVRQELRLTGIMALPAIKHILLSRSGGNIKKQLALTMIEMGKTAHSDIRELLARNTLDVSLIFLKIFADSEGSIWLKETEKLLTDSPHWQVRGQAAVTLGTFNDKTVISSLLKALSDSEPFVRQCAARTLGTLKNPAALEGLLKQLNNTGNDKELNETIIHSLNQITGENFKTAEEYQQWRQNKQPTDKK